MATATDAPAVPLLVQSKPHPPTRRELVPRPELVQRLAGGPGRKLTVISAPAGWGKTTLLADWAASEQEKRPFAWLSLDARDAEGARFWTYLMAALRGLQPQLGMAALELLTAPGVDMEREALPVLLNEIETLPQPSVLALDDYHLVDSPQINAGMSYFVEHLPAVCEVAMTTRVEPPLPLARMRVRGELMEIDATQLRFSAAETGELLNDVLQLDLGSGQVDSLCRRTEGWAAGLYLAALSLRQQPDASGFIDDFAGDDRHIVDYLGSEVLAGLGEEVRDFLVRTSILDRLTAPLCDAVTGRKEAARLLPEIERSNLFLIGLDERREWYRYHHLFGELLRRELERSDPDLAPELHRRAAAWFLARGDADGAIRHTIAAGDHAGAADLVAEHWTAWLLERGDHGAIGAWLDGLPDELVRSDARLGVTRMFVGHSTGRARWPRVLARGCGRGACGEPRSDRRRRRRRRSLVPADPYRRFGPGDRGGHAGDRGGRQALALVPGAFRCPRSRPALAGRPRGRPGGLRGLHARERGAQSDPVRDLDDRLAGVGARRGGPVAGDGGTREPGLRDAPACPQRALDDGRHPPGAGPSACRARGSRGRPGGRGAGRGAGSPRRRPGRPGQHASHRGIACGPMPGSRRGRARFCARRASCSTPAPSRPVSEAPELSERELSVLRLLASPLSQREIGAELYVSLNTVKTHSRHIFRKLGVSARDQAVARARELGLLG